MTSMSPSSAWYGASPCLWAGARRRPGARVAAEGPRAQLGEAGRRLGGQARERRRVERALGEQDVRPRLAVRTSAGQELVEDGAHGVPVAGRGRRAHVGLLGA